MRQAEDGGFEIHGRQIDIKIFGQRTLCDAKLQNIVRKVSEGIVRGVHYLMKKNKITEINGLGAFKDAKTIEVREGKDAGKTITFDNCIIATGSVVRSPITARGAPSLRTPGREPISTLPRASSDARART